MPPRYSRVWHGPLAECSFTQPAFSSRKANPASLRSTKYTPAEVVQFFGRLRDDNEDKQFIRQAREYVLDVWRFVPFACDRTFRRFLATYVFAAFPRPAPSRWTREGVLA